MKRGAERARINFFVTRAPLRELREDPIEET